MKHILAQLVAGRTLTRPQATEAFELIMTGQATGPQIGAFLAFLQTRQPTVEEITGFASVMRAKATQVHVPQGITAIDTCGTGGDHSDTFNISTAAAIIAAGVGVSRNVAVAKHGNRSVTSASGSSQVLEVLGVKIRVSPDTLSRCLREAGLAFCFAPAHHPAMKHAAPVRQELGFRTIFNLIGPLTNPAGARRQVIGVYSAAITEHVAQSLLALGSEHALVVHGNIDQTSGGLDEISTMGRTTISHLRDGKVTTYSIGPEDIGVPAGKLADLKVANPEESAEKIKRLLKSEPGAARDIACLNAGAALLAADLAPSLAAGVKLAHESIDSGNALRSLKTLVEITQADTTP